MSSYRETEIARTGGPGLQTPVLMTMLPGEAERFARTQQNRALFESTAKLVSRFAQGLGWLAQLLTAWWTRARVQDELMEMDDRMLADIGISRADIPAVAAGRYRGHTAGGPRLVADRTQQMLPADAPLVLNDRAPRVA